MAIESVLEQRKEYPLGSLTAQDLFYVQVSKVQDLFRVLGDMAENQVKADHATSSNNLILEVNAIILVSGIYSNLISKDKNSLLSFDSNLQFP